ncbi:transposase-like protein [Rhodococcus sp. 27YEA15]|uniref:transposase n=1 Tax=Rhodococcus sp. 27YEA15 TaxID=3156259 RepID=UPI003C7A704C
MAVEARRDPVTRPGALERIADQLDVHPEALRTWVKRAEVDDGVRPGTTTDDAERIAQVERENRELRRANTILTVVLLERNASLAIFAWYSRPLWGRMIQARRQRVILRTSLGRPRGRDRQDIAGETRRQQRGG